jgi:fibronectin-binding autotransporter adhesin
MKTKLTMLKLLILSCGTFLTTAVFGQTTLVWTNQATANNGQGQIGIATNWNPNGIPNPNSGAPGDTMQFDEQTVGPMSLKADVGLNGGSSGSAVGLVIYMDSNQVDSVNIAYDQTSGFNGTSLRTANITIDPGAGTLSLGNTNQNVALYMVLGGVTGQIHEFLNNSANPAIIYPGWRLAYGGGGSHTISFDGPGNWYVTNSLVAVNGSQTIVTKSGTGTMIWQYANVPVVVQNSQIQGPVTINAGTLILDSGNLLNNLVAGTSTILNNGTLLEYDGQANALGSLANGTIFASISGTGPIQVNNGQLTLAGANTYTGTNILTGGELIAGSVESSLPSGPFGEPSPLANTISFQGGTLGYSAFNGYDYSPRFSTAPGQAYSIDTASQNVTYTNGLTSTGGSLTKLGGGSLTLAGANTYSGLTTVSAGKLVLAGTSGNGNINVADSAALGVVENGTPFTPNTLTLGTLSGAIFEANNVTNFGAAPLQPVNLASTGPVTVNVNSGRFRLIGDTFPLLAWSSGTAPGTSLGFLSGAGGHLVTNGASIELIIDQPPYLWTGAANGTWVAGGPNNWTYSGNVTPWANGNYALFDDSLTANPSVTISGVVSGQTITFGNNSTSYTLNSSTGNDLGGSSSLTMGGSGTTTLTGGANTYTGVTTISDGILIVSTLLANGGSPSDIGGAANTAGNLVLNGGTLQYTASGATIDRLFTLGTAGGTIDNEGGGALILTNSGAMGLSSSGPRTLTLTGVNASGQGDTLGIAVGDGGGPTALVKNGAGNWTLTGTNSYSGGTTLVQGELFVGNGGGTGSLGISGVNNATTIDFNRTGTVTVLGSITGAGNVILDGSGTVILANNNTYSGGTTINQGTLQFGNGGATGAPNTGTAGAIVNDSLLTFNSTGTHILNGVVSGTGNVIVGGGGFEQLLGANTYTGWTLVNAGTIFQFTTGNQGGLTSSVITNNGIVRFDRQDTGVFTNSGPIVGTGAVQNNANNNNAGQVTLTGTNTYTGGTYIGDNTLTFGDNFGGDGTFVGNVTFTNNFSTSDDNQRELDLNIANNFTISGNIVTNFASAQANLGIVQLDGNGTVTLTGNNTYGGGTIVSNGSLVIGAGTTGSVGKGPVTINNSTPLLININNTLNIPGSINGAGVNLVSIGSGTVLLNGSTNSYTGTTTVSNGLFFINGTNMATSDYVTNATFGGQGTLSEPVTLDANCTLEPRPSPVFSGYAPGAPVGTLTINNNLSLNGASYVFAVNKALSPAQSNDMVVANGTLTSTGAGTLTVHNLGPALKVGDTFTLFNRPLPNGNNVTVTGARATWVNNLAFNGSITVASVLGSPVSLSVTNQYQGTSSNRLSFSWTDPFGTDNLLAQTNKLTVGLSTNWSLYPGGGTSPVNVPVVVSTNNPAVFFKLVQQP